MPAPQMHLGDLKVLIVEDEPLILLDCESILRDIGVETIVGVTTAKDAVESLEAAAAPFEIAILDISLQESSSLPLADVLAARGVVTGFMSGYALEDLPGHFHDRPYISKPFAPAQLKQMLEQLIALRRAG
jgi:CheY-like chemotaxis protein